MELRIQTTFLQLDINYIWPRLVINQQPTQIRVETSGPKVEIDQREAWYEIGYSARPLFNKQISDPAAHCGKASAAMLKMGTGLCAV